MSIFLATFAVNGKGSDAEAIKSAVSMLDVVPVAQAANLNVFLIRTEKTHDQLVTLLSECLDPDDYACVVEHPAPNQIGKDLQGALAWMGSE